MTPARRTFLPTVTRHVTREFLGVFVLALSAFVAIYVLAEFFDRIDDYLRLNASAWAIVRLFLFKVPFVLTQVTPVAVLAAALLSLGMLARHNEIVALRACGVSVWQLVLPLLVLGGVLTVLLFTWNETVVPYAARRWLEIENVEIKHRQASSVFMGREIWYHGKNGFYNINKVSLRTNRLIGVTVYQTDPAFRPMRAYQASEARWNGEAWEYADLRIRDLTTGTAETADAAAVGTIIPERLSDFRVVSVEPEELSYGTLRRQIDNLRAKGVDASEGLVDLHLKIAVPVACLLMMAVGVPLVATRGTRSAGMSMGVGLGFLLGFAYIDVVAFGRALGQSGALSPLIAAWVANFIFAMLAGYLLLGAD